MVTHASSTPPTSRTVLFYRDMRAFSGGHLKVFHYYTHVRAARGFTAHIVFGAGTVWDEHNPWLGLPRTGEGGWSTGRGDIFFIAGMDWRFALPRGLRESGKPVINLIQHVRHADPSQDVHAYLGERAIRICVSEEVATAIRATGKVVGPTFVVPNGIEPEPLPPSEWPARKPRQRALIVGTKNRSFARNLAAALGDAGIDGVLHDRFVARTDFLRTLARFPVTVFCPDPTEGFYLPALEGMNRGTFVVCPDCVGNRSFCIDGSTCRVPAYTLPAMTEAVRYALDLSDIAFDAIRRTASETAARHSLDRERERFLAILGEVDGLWGA